MCFCLSNTREFELFAAVLMMIPDGVAVCAGRVIHMVLRVAGLFTCEDQLTCLIGINEETVGF